MATATKNADNSGEGIGCLVLLAVLGYGCYWAYTEIDSVGWIRHNEESVITAQANWFVGESKDCVSYALDAKAAQALNKPTGYVLSKIDCDGGPEHNVPVTVFGRTEQPEHTWINWRCTRNESSFTCKQTEAGVSPQ
jgi:hypothetical protein